MGEENWNEYNLKFLSGLNGELEKLYKGRKMRYDKGGFLYESTAMDS